MINPIISGFVEGLIKTLIARQMIQFWNICPFYNNKVTCLLEYPFGGIR